MKRDVALVTLQIRVVGCAAAATRNQHTIAPAEIGAEIKDRLYHAQVFKHVDVDAAYRHGVATLTGSVDSIGVKQDARLAATFFDFKNDLRVEGGR